MCGVQHLEVPFIRRSIAVLVVSMASLGACGCALAADQPVAIGQPTIFWRDNQWQTWQDGRWVPYGQEVSQASETSREALEDRRAGPERRRGAVTPPGRHEKGRPGRGKPGGGVVAGSGEQPQANVAIGQPTIGIGQPTIGIGQPTIGIGQPTIGIGQPNGIGQPTIGIGRPNAGIGQPTAGNGQRNDIGRTTIGIGKPIEVQKDEGGSPRAKHR